MMKSLHKRRFIRLLMLAALLLVFCLPGTALAEDYYGEDNPQFTMYKASSVITPGQKSTITLTFNNITRYSGYYSYAILTVNEDNTKIFGDDGGNYMSRDIGTIKYTDRTDVSFEFTPSKELKSGSYDMTVTLVYKNRQGSIFTKDYPLTITVDSGTPIDLYVPESSVVGGKAVYGQPFQLDVTLANNGQTMAHEVNVTLTNLSADTIFQSGTYDAPTFTKIPGGSAQHFSLQLIASEDIASGYYPIDLKLNYLENGERKEKTIQVFVEVEGSPDEEDDEDGKVSVPRVILSDYTINPATVNMGEKFSFSFTLKNTSADRTVKNLQVSLTSSEGTVMPASGSNSFYIAEILPGQTKTLSLQMTSKYDTEKTTYPLALEFNYEDAKANPYTATENLTIPVYLPTRLTLQNQNYPEFAAVGESTYLSLEYINQGKGTIYNLTASVEGNVQTDSTSYYIGNITSGSTDTLEIMLTPLEAGTQDCKLLLTYEDAAGNKLSKEEAFTLTAEEMVMDDPGMMDPGMEDPGMMMEEESTGLPGGAKIALAVAAAAAVITAAVVLNKKRKAKKLAAEEALFADDSDLD